MSERKAGKRLLALNVRGEVPKWPGDDEDWTRIEAAYGCDFDAEIRTKVASVVSHYIYQDGFEQRTPFAADAVDWLDQLQKAGATFRAALCDSGRETKAKNDARRYARRALEDHLVSLDWEEEKLDTLARMIADVVAGAQMAKGKLQNWEKKTKRLFSVIDSLAAAARDGEDGGEQLSRIIAVVRNLADAARPAKRDVNHMPRDLQALYSAIDDLASAANQVEDAKELGGEAPKIMALVSDLLLIAETAKDGVEDAAHPSIEDKKAWRNLIIGLTGLFDKRGLPTGSDKDGETNKRPSPFVMFIKELQVTFPNGCRRQHAWSYVALAGAIIEARRPLAED